MSPISDAALQLLQQLLDIDKGAGLLVENDSDIAPELIKELESAFCLECHPLNGPRGGMHVVLRHRYARERLEAAEGRLPE